MTDTLIQQKIIALSKAKIPCEVVYKTQLGSTTIEQGIIRDIFSRSNYDFLILESGLPILISSILSINRMDLPAP